MLEYVRVYILNTHVLTHNISVCVLRVMYTWHRRRRRRRRPFLHVTVQILRRHRVVRRVYAAYLSVLLLFVCLLCTRALCVGELVLLVRVTLKPTVRIWTWTGMDVAVCCIILTCIDRISHAYIHYLGYILLFPIQFIIC